MRWRWTFLLLVLAACSAPPEISPTATPLPTITLLSVHYPLELAYLLPAFQTCSRQVPNSGLLTYESLVPPLPEDGSTLAIWLGEPPVKAGYIGALGFEEVALFVNEGNPVSGLDAAGVRNIFSGLQTNWDPAGPPISIWFPLQGSASARAFETTVGSIRISPNAFLAPSPPIAVQQVGQDPGGITVLPAGWENPDIRIAYSLASLPVTILSQAEPAGPLRMLVSCLQDAQLFRSP